MKIRRGMNLTTIGGGAWYAVGSDSAVFIDTSGANVDKLIVQGEANIILRDRVKLTVNSGIQVGEGNKLNIYGQRLGNGELVVAAQGTAAGIGGNGGMGGTVTINGGIVTATGGANAAGIGGGMNAKCGTVTINGGVVTATGGENGGAGIGGGVSYHNTIVAGGTVTIDGGTVTATGGPSAAGIGGGARKDVQGAANHMYTAGCTVTINGGSVNANGGVHGAGIGGGDDGDGGEVTINGGVVNATGIEGAGIGGGSLGCGGKVTITGGKVTAAGSDGAAGIGGGLCGTSGELTINGGTVTATGGGGAGIGDGRSPIHYGLYPFGTIKLGGKVMVIEGAIGSDSSYVKIVEKPTCGGGTIVEMGGVWVVTPDAGATEVTIANLPVGALVAVPPTVTKVNGVADGQIRIYDGGTDVTDGYIIKNGTVRKILTATFALGEGIANVGFSTTGPVVTNGTAATNFTLDLPQGTVVTLDVVCEKRFAYFGEKAFTVGDENLNVELTAERVSLASVDYRDANGEVQTATDVAIVGPHIGQTLKSGWYVVDGEIDMGSLIVDGEVNLILKDGAKLTATAANTNEAGVAVAPGNALTIYGQSLGTGELVANNVWVLGSEGVSGACIGGVRGGDCGTVTINGGIVTAISAACGAAIGGGYGGAGGTVTVNGGKVVACGYCGYYSAAIGGGYGGAGGTVTINGGTVSAWHTYNATDIGPGVYSSKGDAVTINGGSVKAATIQNAPTNGANAAVYCVTVNVESVESVERLRVEGLEDYGTRDIVPIDGKVYLWLPNGTHVFTIDGVKYRAVVNGAATTATPVPSVIIDTDLGSSMDDLFTVDLAARMQREGKLDLMAVMLNRPDGSNASDDPHGRGEFLKFADRYLASLGLGDLPIGTSTPLTEDRLPQHVFNPYWTFICSNNLTGVGLMLPTNRTDAQIAALTNAVSLYRRLLAGAPDRSLVICSTGFLNNLKALMDSEAHYEGDDIASTGLELIAAKVKELRIMAGCFDPSTAPDGKGGAEYNVAGDPVGAKKVFEEWPTPVVVSTWEVGLKLWYDPKDVLADFPPGSFNPVVRAAYTYWPDREQDVINRLWDVMTVLPLTEGETLVPLSEPGGISVDANGVTMFTADASSNRCYQVASNMNVTAVMDRFREICRTGNPPGPTCEGGEIAVDAEGAWVVTPDVGVSAVEIGGLSNGVEVVGVKIGASVVPAAAFVGFGERNTAGVFSLALNPEGVVTIDDKEIPVKPTIGDLDAGEPFAVGEGSAAVTVRAIPGLKYELRRWETLDAESAVSSKPPYQVVTDKVAEGASVTLSDDDPPADKAFYAIGVSVP